MPILYRNIEHPNPKRSSVSDPLKHIENVGQISLTLCNDRVKEKLAGTEFCHRNLESVYIQYMYEYIHTFSDGWGQLKGSGPVHIMHTVRINIRQIYILMNISESNLSLKLQQYITFTSAHQQIFIEISIILIFFLSVQYIYWSA